jgi:hypothetical protein
MSARGTELTEKQAKYVKNRAKGLNKTDSAIKAGYSEKVAGQAAYAVEKSIERKMPQVLEKANLGPDVLVARYLKRLLNARETKFFAHQGKVIEKKTVAAQNVRLGALIETFKLGGHYSEDHGNTDVNINILWNGPAPAWAGNKASPDVRLIEQTESVSVLQDGATIPQVPVESTNVGIHNCLFSDTVDDQAEIELANSHGMSNAGEEEAKSISYQYPPVGSSDVGGKVLDGTEAGSTHIHEVGFDRSSALCYNAPEVVPQCQKPSRPENEASCSTSASLNPTTKLSENSPTKAIQSGASSGTPCSSSSAETPKRSLPELVREHKLEWPQ